ncbi:MAG: DUF2520 domain-containing protein [Phycisphaerae bacterium]|nr:DUF2520 domain-containing protein [Phycisphaerae bacterium]
MSNNSNIAPNDSPNILPNALPKISIIGAGCVGSAIGQLVHRAGYKVAAVSDIDSARAKQLGAIVDAQSMVAADACAAGQLVLLTVPDDKISQLCQKLAEAGAFGHKPVVAHCSGALGSDALAAAEQVGCQTGSMHPLQTFPDSQAAMKAIPGARFFIEGSEPAAEMLRELAVAIGAKPADIKSDAKVLYHAAAVMASNYFVTLMDTASELLAKAGLTSSESLNALGPLVRATFENVFDTKNPAAALTGPIARGDVKTVERHLAELAKLSASPGGGGDTPSGGGEIIQLYKAAGLRTVILAEKKGSITPEQAKQLRAMLES